MTRPSPASNPWLRIPLAALAALLVVGGVAREAAAQTTRAPVLSARLMAPPALGHLEHAVALSEDRARQAPRALWAIAPDLPGRRWPFRADPRRWPRLFANTTECTLGFDPVLRRHWWQ
ncbi:MAG: hypothetical protein K2Y23_04045 [Cyanobacteria bacterium]|nr:hypothetical protein [Cyanobacteriota bacterium]